MQVDWFYGLIGGLLIGCAGAGFLLVNGRIMGASGIIGSLVDKTSKPRTGENILFIAGVIAAPLIVLGRPEVGATNFTGNWLVIIAGGFLVGVGTRLANGCTSGHGVCGMSRLSMRGITATIIYILAGVVTVAMFRHVLGAI